MTQHIENRLAALGEKATQGKWEIVEPHPWFEFERIFSGSTFICSVSNTDMQSEERRAITNHVAALHNAAPALLAVVRAARQMFTADGLVVSKENIDSIQSALAALDKVEV